MAFDAFFSSATVHILIHLIIGHYNICKRYYLLVYNNGKARIKSTENLQSHKSCLNLRTDDERSKT